MELKPIGYIESCFPEKFGTPRQPGLVPSARAKMQLRREIQPEQALLGLEGFSHIWVIFEFHLNSNLRYHSKVHPPRLGGESIGVFATRSPHRPNPLGLSLVRLEKIEGDTLYLLGGDLVDGTPVYDIKPYLPHFESLPTAKVGWVDQALSLDVVVQLSAEAESVLAQIDREQPEIQIRRLIKESIGQDPRPLAYKKEGFDQKVHALRLYKWDIHFVFLDDKLARVERVTLF